MQIHIAPIGNKTEHVIEWIKETPPVKKIWLIHSKKNKTQNIDFPKKAKDCAKKIKSFYDDCEIKFAIIEDSLGIDDTMDKINEIVTNEEKENEKLLKEGKIDEELSRKDFLINVTGGTNAVAAGAILSATLLGTRAHYIKNKSIEPNLETYLVDLPIPPLGILKMNETFLQVLKIIAKGNLIIKDPDGKTHLKKGPGVITNSDVLKEMSWDKVISTGKRNRKRGATNMRAIALKLKNLGYIRIIKGIPSVKQISFGHGKKEWQLVEGDTGGVMYEITSLGRRQAKNALMID